MLVAVAEGGRYHDQGAHHPTPVAIARSADADHKAPCETTTGTSRPTRQGPRFWGDTRAGAVEDVADSFTRGDARAAALRRGRAMARTKTRRLAIHGGQF